MLKIVFVSICILSFCLFGITQNNLCVGADPFCTGTTYSFPAGVNQPSAQSGPNYGCLGSQPNPVWYYLLIDQPGNIQIDIHSVPQHDVDFVCWGPFTSQTAPCMSQLTATGPTPSHNGPLESPDYPAGNMIDCGYNSTYQEWCYIPNAQSGQYYIFMITNYSNSVCNIVMTQVYSGTNAGSTNCNPCKCGFFDNMTHTVNPCNPQTNQYSVNGNIIFHFTPSTYVMPDSMVITDYLSGVTQIIHGPFTNSSSPLAFTLNNIPSDGLIHDISAYFSSYIYDTYTNAYTAPDSCSFSAAIENIASETFSIFPNPTSENVKLILKEYSGEVQIILSNIYGQEVLRTKMYPANGNDLILPLDNCLPGIYSLSVKTDLYERTVKLIIQ